MDVQDLTPLSNPPTFSKANKATAPFSCLMPSSRSFRGTASIHGGSIFGLFLLLFYLPPPTLYPIPFKNHRHNPLAL